MRCLSLIIVLAFIALLALTTYNYIQIEHLKSELLRTKDKTLDRSASKKEWKEDDLAGALARAREHLSNARKFSGDGEKIKAINELDEALKQIESASNMAKSIASDTGGKLTDAWDKVRKEADKTIKDISEQIKDGGVKHDAKNKRN